jgi:myo-inositol-1(or 4)-monophosphatase
MPSILRNGRPVKIDLSQQQLDVHSTVFVSAAAVGKPELNEELCAPGLFHAMPSIAYRLARVAVGDGVCAVSLYPVAAHDVVAGHALLRASKGSLLDQDGYLVLYNTCMTVVSQRCFGGAPAACRVLSERDWGKLLSHPA